MSAPISSKLAPVLTSVEKAKGLPNEHYISQEIFEEEKKSVLFNNWSAVGFGKDIPEAGDAKPIEFLGIPLLIVRTQDGSISVFQNTCRHRGMILVDEPKKIKGAIRCPYHSWCYSLKGELKSTPYVGGPALNHHPDIKNEELGLFGFPSYVWNDIIFVNISGKAPAFEDYAADLIEQWKEFNQPIYHGGASSSFKLEVNTNWKLAIENYCESYHLPWVHPALNSYSRIEDHYHIEKPGKYSGQGTLVYRQLKGESDEVFPDYKNLTQKWDEGAEYVALYPNVLLGVHRDHFFSIILEPISLDRTVEHVEIYYTQASENTPELSILRDKNAEQWKTVFLEDVFVVEGMQKGRYGPVFDGGKFSPAMDGPTHNFHHWIASEMNSGRNS